MRPALSVIFFTTLSGAGYGLLAWQGLALLLSYLRNNPTPELRPLQQGMLAVGIALATVGLLCSLAHLGKPGRAWRAMSQWRTSWLSREGLIALATLLPALALVMLLRQSPGVHASWLPVLLAMLMATGALLTVICTAMIYASLRTIPAWRHPLVVPAYVLFALAAGQALHFTGMTLMLGGSEAQAMLINLSIFGLLLAVLKWAYWYEIDRAALPATRGDAVGLPQRDVATFERPHTEASYITREMAFVLARRHGMALRWLATALLAGGPLVALGLVGMLTPVAALAAATASVLAGAFVERWLFFAQARHLVTLYY